MSDAREVLRLDAELVRAVRADVERFAMRSPIVDAPELAGPGIGGVGLKLESLQPTGSFKIRGAAAKIGSLDPSELAQRPRSTSPRATSSGASVARPASASISAGHCCPLDSR